MAQPKEFRINARQFFLTYPQCGLEKVEVLRQLREKFAAYIEAYVVAVENHADGEPHIHVYLKFDRKINAKGATRFDLEDAGGGTFHGNYQSARSAKSVIAYIRKDGDFIADGVEAVKKTWDEALAIAQAGKPTEAFALLCREKARDVVMRGREIRANLQSLAPLPTYQPASGLSPPVIPLNLSAKLGGLGMRSLIVHGAPGTGKTVWARSLGEHRFVTHLEQLRTPAVVPGELLVFDDMSFAHLPRTTCIYLVDCENERMIHVRYGTVSIPAGVRKIFLTNGDPAELFSAWDDALQRRCECIYIASKMW